MIDDAVVDTGLPQFSQQLRKLREKEKQPPVFVKRHSTAGPVICQACEMLGRRQLKEVSRLGRGKARRDGRLRDRLWETQAVQTS